MNTKRFANLDDEFSWKTKSYNKKLNNTSHDKSYHLSTSYKKNNNSYNRNNKKISINRVNNSYKNNNNSYRKNNNSYKNNNNSYRKNNNSYKNNINSYRNNNSYKNNINSYRNNNSYKKNINSYRNNNNSYRNNKRHNDSFTQNIIDRDTKYLDKCRKNSPFARLTYEEFYALPIIELKEFFCKFLGIPHINIEDIRRKHTVTIIPLIEKKNEAFDKCFLQCIETFRRVYGFKKEYIPKNPILKGTCFWCKTEYKHSSCKCDEEDD